MKTKKQTEEHTHKKKKQTKKRTARTKFPFWQFMVLLICIPAFLISSYFFLCDLFRYRAEDRANTELAQKIQQVRDSSDDSGYTGPTSDKFTEYETLWEQNQDFAGWLFIEDTRIDYPVMHTPDEPEYYLHRAFDGSDASSGCLFVDAAYSIDSNSLLIYGHHMKDRSMFGSLTDYRSQDFASEHSVIHFDTLTEERDYEVLAAFYWDVFSEQEENSFYYYKYPDLSSPEVFDEYVRQVKARSIYDTGVTCSYGDRILTLSTCSSHSSNGRFVVVAVAH